MSAETFFQKLKRHTSRIVIALIAIYWVVFSFRMELWEKNHIKDDVINYYTYLPAAFIQNDLSLRFILSDSYFSDKVWPSIAPNGAYYAKMTMGLSIMYSPFFFLGHLQATLTDDDPRGYSRSYQNWLVIGGVVYLLLGLLFLRKVLLRYFSDPLTGLLLLLIFFGTNLVWYSTGEVLMPHVFLFCLVSILLYLTIRWHETPIIKFSILLGLVMGLIILIRPVHAILALVPLLYNVSGWNEFREKLAFLRSKSMHLLIIVLCIFLIGFPQLLYWKHVTGSWFFYSYGKEHFYWDNPHILDGLLSFRKGWLIYTPLMITALAGFFYIGRYVASFRTVLLVTFPLFIYIAYSWWCWWYGGTFGQRSMIDIYPLLALPMGAFFKHVSVKRIIAWSGALLLPAIIALNLFQTWQFSEGLLHFDSMTARAYTVGFLQTHFTEEWKAALVEPDIKKAENGYPEKHMKEDYYFQKISLLGVDSLKYVSSEINLRGELTLSRLVPNEWEHFLVTPVDAKRVSLKAANGKYVTADQTRERVLHADRENAWDWEKFELVCLDDRKAVLKDFYGYYVRCLVKYRYLAADVRSIDSATVFKLKVKYVQQ